MYKRQKQLSSSIARDVSCVEDWDAEIEEEARRARETAAQQSEEEDWDAPESQTDPGNGLTWDEMITWDHGVAPSWVERQEQERIDRSLPWRWDPEGSIWQRDPSPRWRIREEWANASVEDREGIMKYKLVMGPDSAFPGYDVHPQRQEEDSTP